MSTYGAFHIYRKLFIFSALLLAVALVSPMLVMADNAADAAALDALSGTLSALGSNEGYTGAQLNALNQANAAIGAAAKNLRAKPADLAAAKKALENAKKILNGVTDWKSTSGQSTVNHAVDELQAEIDRLVAALAAGNTGTTAGSGTSLPPLPTVPLGAKTSPLLGEGTSGSAPVEAPVTNPVSPQAPSPTVPLTTQKQFSAAQVIYQAEKIRDLITAAAGSTDGTAKAFPLKLPQLPGTPTVDITASSKGVVDVKVSGGGTYDVVGTLVGANDQVLDEFHGSAFTILFNTYKEPRALSLFVTYLPEAPVTSVGGTSGGFVLPPATGATPPPVSTRPEGLSEPISEPVITATIPGTKPPTAQPPVVVPPTPSQSGPEVVPPSTIPPEVAPPTTGAGETTVTAQTGQAPIAEDINFDLAFTPADQSAPISDRPPTPLITSPESGTSFTEGNTIPDSFDFTPSQSGIGDLSFSSFSVPAFVTSPLPQPLSGVTPAVKGPSAPIPPTQPGEQVNVITPADQSTENISVTLDVVKDTEPPVIPMTEPADGSVVIDGGGLNFFNDIGAVSGFSWELPQNPISIDFTQPSQPAKSNDLTIPAGAEPGAGVTLVEPPSVIGVTLEIANPANEAAQAVQSGADAVNETINGILEFVNP